MPSTSEGTDEYPELSRSPAAGYSQRSPFRPRRGAWEERLDTRIAALENSRIFRTLRRAGQILSHLRHWYGHKLLQHPVLHRMYLRFSGGTEADPAYRLWLAREAEATPPRQWFEERIQHFPALPQISIVIPCSNPNREWLDAAIRSVRDQVYGNWQLCIADDASTDPWVHEYLLEIALRDPRIRYAGQSPSSLGISSTLNRTRDIATGDYVAFLDHDDVLSPHALFYIVETLQDNPADLLYTDEDHLNPAGEREDPIFRPGWSPDLLLSCMYMGHLLVVSRRALDAAGWFRPKCDGSQDHDLALRITEQSQNRVCHIPRVLYHWRRHRESTAAGTETKHYTHPAGRRAVEDAIQRRQWDARVEDGPRRGTYRIVRALREKPLVSLILCSRNAQLLRRSTQKLRAAYPATEIVVVQHLTGDDAAMTRFIQENGFLRVPYAGTFHFARMNNQAVSISNGSVLVFLNDDTEPQSPEWLEALVSQCTRPEAGIAGASLVYPLGVIQHAGITLGFADGAGHPCRGTFGSRYWHWTDLARNVSAVTGACLAIRRNVFEMAGGFDEQFPANYNDVDLCLRVRSLGFEVLYEPRARLLHRESASRSSGIVHSEQQRWLLKWETVLNATDPYFNPNLSTLSEDVGLRLEDDYMFHGME